MHIIAENGIQLCPCICKLRCEPGLKGDCGIGSMVDAQSCKGGIEIGIANVEHSMATGTATVPLFGKGGSSVEELSPAGILILHKQAVDNVLTVVLLKSLQYELRTEDTGVKTSAGCLEVLQKGSEKSGRAGQ